jgi:hypothetical protein
MIVIFICIYTILHSDSASAATGNDWLKWSKDAQQFYVTGVFEGWNQAVPFCKQTHDDCEFIINLAKPFLSCFTGSPYSQIFAIIQKYMQDHPQQWHQNMALLIWTAVAESCNNSAK